MKWLDLPEGTVQPGMIVQHLISSEEVYQEQECSPWSSILLEIHRLVKWSVTGWVQGDTGISMTNQQIISKETLDQFVVGENPAMEADSFKFRSSHTPLRWRFACHMQNDS